MDKQPPIAKITASLSISGQDFDVARFSQIAGREPTEIWHAKVPGVKNNPAFDQIAWEYQHTKQPRWSIDAAIRAILDVFRERQGQIVAFARQYNCSLHLSLVLHGDTTVIIYEIERETVELMAAFQCSISFAIDLD